MNLDYLYEFAVLAEHMNFTAAAQALFITQPTLSKHISTLERQLGRPLLLRDSHQVSLTEAGRALLPDAQEIRLHYERILHCQRQELAEQSLSIRVGIPHMISDTIPRETIAAFQRAHPELQVDHAAYYEVEEMLEDLQQRSLDAILVQHDTALEFGLQYRKVFSCPIYIACSATHPLARRDMLTPHDLVLFPFITRNRIIDTVTRKQVTAYAERLGLSYEFQFTKATAESLLYAVVSSDFLTLIPSIMQLPAHPELRTRPAPFPIRQDVSLAWLPQSPRRTELLQAFAASFGQIAARMNIRPV